MADSYRPPDGFVTMGEAQQRLGVSRVTIISIVRDAACRPIETRGTSEYDCFA